MKHVHADLIKQWAGDTTVALQRLDTTGWFDIDNPVWSTDRKYRIKPKMIKVGRHEWPAPLASVPDDCVVFAFSFEFTDILKITTKNYCEKAVQEGVAHATREAAQQHRDALIYISKGDI
jgi:hypothetical protein